MVPSGVVCGEQGVIPNNMPCRLECGNRAPTDFLSCRQTVLPASLEYMLTFIYLAMLRLSKALAAPMDSL